MSRLTAFRIGFLSVLGSFMLLLSLLASTGTASAYTGNVDHPVVPQRPQLSAFVVSQAGPSSIEVRVFGSGFRPGSVVFLSATAGGRYVSVQPMTIRANWNGTFSRLVRIQQPFQMPSRLPFLQSYRGYPTYPTQIVLHATDLFGRSASQALLLNRIPYPGFQFGLVR